MAKKITTLYIDDTSLRLMIAKEDQIIKWAELPLEPGLVENMVVIKETEFAGKVKQLFKDNKVRTSSVIVGISGLRCLTRSITLPQLPEEMLKEAVRQEAETAFQVPLEQMYLSWHVVRTVGEKILVYMVATPRETIDSLFKALRKAGLKPTFMDLKPLLLAGMVEEEMAIIVDIQNTEFDIAIMSGGIPQPVRTVLLPKEAEKWQEKLTTISNELDRTITFHNSDNPENFFSSDVPILVSGDMANESELCQTLSEKSGHPVLPLSSPLQYPEEFTYGHYMANIGIVHQQLANMNGGSHAVNQNVLPASYLPKHISSTHITYSLGAVLATGILAALVILTQNASGQFATSNSQFDTVVMDLQRKTSQQQELNESIADLEAQLTGLTVSRDGITAVLDGLEKQRFAISRDLNATIMSLPAGVSLSNIGHITSILTTTGEAPSEEKLLSYISKLDESGRFGNIIVTDVTRNDNETMDFTLVATLQAQSIGASSMEIALGSLPSTVVLTGINTTANTLVLIGTSPSEDKIFSYLRALEASERFSVITVNRITKTTDEEMYFSLNLKGVE